MGIINGAGQSISDADIKGFFATNPNADQIASKASELGLNQSQISSAMGIAGYGGNTQAERDAAINGYVGNSANGYSFGTGGILSKAAAPASPVTPSAPASYTTQQYKDWFPSNLDNNQIMAKAKSLGLNSGQLTQALATMRGVDLNNMPASVAASYYADAQNMLGESRNTFSGGGGMDSFYSPKLGRAITPDEIKSFTATAKSPAEWGAMAAQLGVSPQIIARVATGAGLGNDQKALYDQINASISHGTDGYAVNINGQVVPISDPGAMYGSDPKHGGLDTYFNGSGPRGGTGTGGTGGGAGSSGTGSSGTGSSGTGSGSSSSSSSSTTSGGTAPWNVTPDQTVEGRINAILNPNNPIIQQARTGALEGMNARGILNSSLSTTASDAAAYQAAIPIAAADAATAAKAAGYNADQTNQFTQADKNRATQVQLANINADTQKQLASMDIAQKNQAQALQLSNSTLLQTNSQAASIFNTGMSAINNITQNNQMDADTKTRATANVWRDVQSQLNVIGATSGLNLTSQLNFAGYPGFDAQGKWVGFEDGPGATTKGTKPAAPTPPATTPGDGLVIPGRWN